MNTKQSAFGKPATLWELCEQTVEAILARPLNYYQDDYYAEAQGCMFNKNGAVLEGACGTAYCRSGWMGTILGLETKYLSSVPEELLENAGIDSYQVNKLFSAIGCLSENNPFERSFFYSDGDERRPGTKAYARAGAAGLKKFMRRYEKNLKAARLVKQDDQYSIEISDVA